MTAHDHKRSDRVGERIRAEIMDLLLRGGVRDPATRDGFVTAVKVSADLRHARVYVRLTDVEAAQARRDACRARCVIVRRRGVADAV